MSWPRKNTPPPVGRSSDRISLAVVVFPHPLSPTRPSVSPRRRTKSTPSTAFTVPKRRLRIVPRASGKCLVSRRASRTTVAGAECLDGHGRRYRGNRDRSPDQGGGLVGPKARHQMLGVERLERRACLLAARLRHRAARREAAAPRHVSQIRRLPLDGRQRLAPAAQGRQAIEETHRVRMARTVEDVTGAPESRRSGRRTSPRPDRTAWPRCRDRA